VHLQKVEYENALIQLNQGLDVFVAVMTMRRFEKTNVFSVVVFLIFVICAASLHTDAATLDRMSKNELVHVPSSAMLLQLLLPAV
jgi:hypothetical protein